MSCGTGIDDGEATMAETNSLAGGGRIGRPEAVVVTSSMLDSLEHGRDMLLGIDTDYSGDAAHWLTQFRVSGSEFRVGLYRRDATGLTAKAPQGLTAKAPRRKDAKKYWQLARKQLCS